MWSFKCFLYDHLKIHLSHLVIPSCASNWNAPWTNQMCAHKRLCSVKSFPHYLHLNLNAECVISMWYSKCFFDDNLKLHLSHFLIPPCAGKGCPSYVRILYLRVVQGLLSYLCLANKTIQIFAAITRIHLCDIIVICLQETQKMQGAWKTVYSEHEP